MGGIPSTDPFRSMYSGAGGVDWPATHAEAVTPNTDNDLPNNLVTRGLWVGGAGDLVVILAEDTAAVTFTGVGAGQLLPIRVKRVLATSTCTGIVALS